MKKNCVTNIFCLLGKPGSGRLSILNSVLNDTVFCDKYKLERLVYGTTRPIRPGDIDGETYHFMNEDQYKDIPQGDIIECRSYDIVYTDDIHYYFTLNSYIQFGKNYIVKASTVQYSEYKKWALLTQLKNSMLQINIYPILVNAPIFEREKRMMLTASTEDDVYSMCSKFITEKYEFKLAINENPELIDPDNRDSCILDNSKSGRQNILLLKDQLETFIGRKIIMQGL